MEVRGLTIRNFSLIAILFLTLSASISLVLAQDISSDDANRMMKDTVDVANAVNTMENNATAKENTPTDSVSVQGIWKASFGEKEIIMVVNQSGQSVFGRAKFEGGNPWNGAIAGSLSANAVSFSMAAMESEVLASTYISATLEGDRMKGLFIRSDSSGKASRGDFTATMISPDTSSYNPAQVTSAPLPAVQTEQVSTTQKNEANASEENEKPAPVPVSESKFKDVTELAKGIDPNILPRMAPL
jgi:hypothetical protein